MLPILITILVTAPILALETWLYLRRRKLLFALISGLWEFVSDYCSLSVSPATVVELDIQ